ncbi:endoribonuclease Dcr-1 isoform 1-T2 [Glossina fuscipes fuscipes]
MSFHWCDNLHTTVFSPRDYQVELLASAFERNTMICLGHRSSKQFISLKLLQELGREARFRNLGVSIYLSNNKTPAMYVMLQHMTDLRVYQETSESLDELPKEFEVYILKPKTCLVLLKNGRLKMENIQIIVLEDCHQDEIHSDMLSIFREFYVLGNQSQMPKVLGLAGPLHSAGCDLAELSAMLNNLETSIHSKTETASDIVTVLRYCAKPTEFIVQCAPYAQDELSFLIEDIILTRKAFLTDHRYDPFEIYSTDEFLEELKDIPDPKKEPLEFLDILLSVLHEMGPWCADRVALNMYHRIEKQKIKTPHERHYILLCLVNTALLEIRAICEQHFRKFSDNHKVLVHHYSTPKVLRLLEVLRLFKPEERFSKNDGIKKISMELEQMDFPKLTRVLETKCHIVEQAIEKQTLQSRSIIENLDSIVKPDTDLNTKLTSDSVTNAISDLAQQKTEQPNNLNSIGSSSNRRSINYQLNRIKRRPFNRRYNRELTETADNLCAIIFCSSNYTARVLFDLLAEMSRHDLDLKFLKCQYTTDRVADPLTEPKEAEIEHRRQEEVLKRFRMHDCNVLIGTSVLEEGIDVPKCNLVIRWDPPITYRSYVQCKGRARAVPAYHVILVAADSENMLAIEHKNEQLNARSHRLLCNLPAEEDNMVSDSENSDDDDIIEYGEDINNVSKKQRYTYDSGKGTVKILNPEVITNKPPTTNFSSSGSDLILKEIKDDTPAIEDVTADPEIDAQTDLNETHSPDVTLVLENNDLKMFDINVNLEESPDEESKEEKKIDKPIKEIKEKKYFQCSLENTMEKVESEPEKQEIEDENEKLKSMVTSTKIIVKQMAYYREIEKMLLENCVNTEPPDSEHKEADAFNNCIIPYKPLAHLLTGASVDLGNSIALINKYCAKLPSDTFTKLTPLWRCSRTIRNNVTMYQCTLRLPINSPLKYDIVGLPMHSQVLSRRMAALQACVQLHKYGELDDNLQPIGKESFKAIETDWENFELEEQDERIVQENSEPRPGTTKRRQYYYKRIASEFCDCRPVAGEPCYLYLLDLTLQCPIPEEQNTRGRKIYPPEDALQGFGILTLKKIPKVSSFPIFTRSGEVKVSLELYAERITLNERQISSINTFINYTFTKVLRLKKFLMLFDPESTENCVFIIPTVKTDDGSKVIDWSFLELIEENANMMPTAVPEEIRHATEFDAEKFKDAVVMPWYRNQDHPHYFYVAEICHQLSPLSIFPSKKYRTFMHYYYLKYGLKIHPKQPLLDVDHTSARLNFLTPRYVNRKGVALPTSSEATKRAKRENLELKQILVPELCTVHPFPASLWRTAVCLPCILYRINGLLLADDIRKKVVADIGLGQPELPEDQEWPMLDFGWSLSDVLKKSKINESAKTKQEDSLDQIIKDCGKKVHAFTLNGEESEIKIENKTINEIVEDAELKLQEECGAFIEIGTWSNDMANYAIKDDDTDSDYDDLLDGIIPPFIKFCGKSIRATSPTFTDIQLDEEYEEQETLGNGEAIKEDPLLSYDSDDSFAEFSLPSDEDWSAEESCTDDYFTFTSKNEAETIETEQDIEKFNKQISIIQATKENERNYQETKNLQVGYNFPNIKDEIASELKASIERFQTSTSNLINEIEACGMLVPYDKSIQLLEKKESKSLQFLDLCEDTYKTLLPYVNEGDIKQFLTNSGHGLSLDVLENFNSDWVKEHPEEQYVIYGCGDIFDSFNDKQNLDMHVSERKLIKLNFENHGKQYEPEKNKVPRQEVAVCNLDSPVLGIDFSFDRQPDLMTHPGPSPSIILQALTMSNANDGINLERLETIGDSFLKYAITTYLYITYENVHEGKLSHLRSKQVANLNLYRLGRRKQLGEYMIATKFEPSDNWLPPCYYVPKELEKAFIEAKIPPHYWGLVDLVNIKRLSNAEICELVREKADEWGLNLEEQNDWDLVPAPAPHEFPYLIPYNLVSQHSIPDKSVADCVEALIGAYLIECGLRGALLFMAWLGIRVLPYERIPYNDNDARKAGSTLPDSEGMSITYGSWSPPKSPLLHFAPKAEKELEDLLAGYDKFEDILGYKFRDKSYLLQAMTHASYTPNRLTDCYQRLEFLGDAVLDYLITRHLYEDPRQHSPGALTDLRSALVNNTIFASLAVRHGFHKYFRHLSPALNEVIDRFVRIQTENGHSISEEYYLLSEEECDDAEDVEVPKALGDVFESVAGAIFLDSNMSLDEVWRVYSNMMRPEIEQFSNSVPKSPIRELLELEPETAKFGKPEKLADGRRVRVTVEVFCKGTYRGIGRNYRIAKCTAAKCALRQLKKKGLIDKKN